jgi:CRP-like cAMP-binding protein
MAVQTLGAHEIFSYLSPNQVDAISDASEVISRSAGDTVYYQGASATHLYVLLHGQVALRLPGRGGVSLLVEQIGEGALFGSCVCFDIDAYSLTAQCVTETQLLRIEAATLRRMMENDLTMGFALQRHITNVYFKRYLETMKKLQSIVLSMPLEGV